MPVADQDQDALGQVGHLGGDAVVLVQPQDRQALAPHQHHLGAVGVPHDGVGVVHLEVLLDRGDRHDEGAAPHRDRHAVHDGQGQRDLDGEGGALAGGAVDRDRAAHLFEVLLHHVHANAAARELGDLLVGREAGQHDQRVGLAVGVFGLGLREQAVVRGLAQDGLTVQPAAVVRDLDHDLAAHVVGREGDGAAFRLAGLDTLIRHLDGVIHRVAHHVHEGVAQHLVDGLVHLGVAADGGQLCLLAQLFAHVAHDAVHLLEDAGQRHHPHAHHHILQLVGQLAQLAGRFHVVVQLEAAQVGVVGHHRLGGHDLAHQVHQVVQLALRHADQALHRPGGGGGRLGGGCGSRGLGGSGGGRLGGRGLGRGVRVRGGGGLLLLGGVQHLVAAHVHRGLDGVADVLQVRGRLADDLKAVVPDHRAERGVGLGMLRVGVELVAQVLELGHQHKGAHVLQLAPFVKKDPDVVDPVALRRAGGGGGGRGRFGGGRAGRGGRGRRGLAALHPGSQGVQLLHQLGRVAVALAGVLQRFQLGLEEVRRLEDKVKDRVRHGGEDLRGVAEDGKDILHRVGQRRDAVQPHHGGRALDRVHHAEDLVDVLDAEVFGFFRVQQNLIQGVEQGRIFVDQQFHWFHIRVKIHRHWYPP